MSPDPTRLNPVCVPVCVLRVSQQAARASAGRVCPRVPSPTEGTHTASPPNACPPSVSQPWFRPHEINWHYPDPNHASTNTFPRAASVRRNTTCPLCGAPPQATCVTKSGTPTNNRHKARAHVLDHKEAGSDG